MSSSMCKNCTLGVNIVIRISTSKVVECVLYSRESLLPQHYVPVLDYSPFPLEA